MKKFLSLVLALVMVMSLVTVSAGAKDFTDDDSITYDEAVDVISTIGVVDGDTNGAFRPTDTLTRQAAAKIICNLILGPTTASELHADTAPYRDVAANNQFAGYIAYCQAKGIISGYADGTFRPTGTLTGYAFMKMLLGALGYDASLERYVGDNWSINVAKQALHIKLNKGLEGDFNGLKAVTRQEACLYAFNTLQADLVEYGQRLTTNVNGTEVVLSTGGAKSREWNSQQTRINSIRDDNIVQFAEEYFSKLVKTPDTDIFERPAHTWVFDKKIQIGTWVDQDKLLETYTDEVSARDLYDLLGSATIRDYDMNIYVDGHVAGTGESVEYQYTPSTKEIAEFDNLTRSNTKTVGATGKGVLTEVFKDDDAEEIIVVSIHTWLAQANSSYSETREAATLKVFMTNATGTTKTVNVEDVPAAADVVNEAFYLVTMSDKETAKLEVVSIEEPEILEESTITKYSTDNERPAGAPSYPSKLTTGGNEYNKSNTAIYDAETLDLYNEDYLANNTYNVYVDKYGYFIGVDLFEGVKQYVFITGYDMKNSNLAYKTAEAAGIFLDGTMDTLTVNVKDTNKNIQSMVYGGADNNWSTPKAAGADGTNAKAYYQRWDTNASQGVYLLNRWYTYTKTDAGVYTLKPCVNKDGVAMMMASESLNAVDGDGDAEVLKLNASKLRLDSVVDNDTATDNQGNLLMGETMTYTNGTAVNPVLKSYRAYGEDDSVFITVDVDEVSAVAAKDLPVTKAITDVNGVYTGVQDVNMLTSYEDRVVGAFYQADGSTVAGDGDQDFVGVNGAHDGTPVQIVNTKDLGYLGENAYAVFDKNNFIIGAIILGEAEGSSATKAYILDPVKYERIENGTYYWQFEAVINGEIVTQEAESKYPDTIRTMVNHQYEIVELRYKDADKTIVSDVKALDHKDVVGNLGAKADKVYGYPFGEIKNHAVDPDKESVYDVVLTGVEGASYDTDTTASNNIVGFSNVERPAIYNPNQSTARKLFVETELGYLNLQGRTLWVLGNTDTASPDADHGIDFTRDAKAVVIQPEGTPADYDMETRAYGTVKEAVDSLSDGIDPNTAVKEFRGIITAALNSQGVAEWIVFYSDTLLDTRASDSPQQATMDVRINVQLPGEGQVRTYGVVKVPRSSTNGNYADVPSPDVIARRNAGKGDTEYGATGVTYPYPMYRSQRDFITILWDRHPDEIPEVTFIYNNHVDDADNTAVNTAKTNTVALDGDAINGATRLAAQAAAETAITAAVGRDADTVSTKIVSFTAPTTSAAGSLVVDVTLTKGGATATVEGLTFTVAKLKVVASITVNGAPATTTYTAGTAFDPTGITSITVNYDDASTETILAADFATKGVTFTPATLSYGDTAVKANYGGKSSSNITVTVNARAATVSVTAATLNLAHDAVAADTSITASINNGGALQGATVTSVQDNGGTNTAAAADLSVSLNTTTGVLSIGIAGGKTPDAGDTYTITVTGKAEDTTTAATTATVVVTLT